VPDWYWITLVVVGTVIVFSAGVLAGRLLPASDRRPRQAATGRVPVARRRPAVYGSDVNAALSQLPPYGPAVYDATSVLADLTRRDAQTLIAEALPPVDPSQAMQDVLAAAQRLEREMHSDGEHRGGEVHPVPPDAHDADPDNDDGDDRQDPPDGGHTGSSGDGPVMRRYQLGASSPWPTWRGVLPRSPMYRTVVGYLRRGIAVRRLMPAPRQPGRHRPEEVAKRRQQARDTVAALAARPVILRPDWRDLVPASRAAVPGGRCAP